MKVISVITLFGWLAVAIYFGIGGLARARLDETLQDLESQKATLKKDSINLTYDGLSFTNKYDLKYFLEAESIEKVFPWSVEISSFMSLIITAFSFGLLGGVISLIKEMVFEKTKIEDLRVVSVPLLGFLTGFVVLGLSYLLPTVLTKNGTEIRPVTLMFLCLFGGMYSAKFYEKLALYFNKLFL